MVGKRADSKQLKALAKGGRSGARASATPPFAVLTEMICEAKNSETVLNSI